MNYDDPLTTWMKRAKAAEARVAELERAIRDHHTETEEDRLSEILLPSRADLKLWSMVREEGEMAEKYCEDHGWIEETEPSNKKDHWVGPCPWCRVAELEFELKMWRYGRLFHEPPFVVDEDVRWKAALRSGWKGFPTADEAIKALREEESL